MWTAEPLLGPLALDVVESFHTGVLGLALKLLLDADELVVLGNTVAAARGARHLIWPALTPTTRSAIVESSVSPERWLTMQA